ncbi:MAG: glycosyltransferase [Chitinophagales bacterium]
MIAPLDWGLGHATRCIPIIRSCLALGHDVIIVSTGRSLQLLKKEFPQLIAIDVPAYDIYYQEKGSFIFKIISQLGKVFKGIKRENRATRQILKTHQVDLIISDNRYGIHSRKIYSIIISHQMMVKMPQFRMAEPFVYLWLQWQHKNFDAIWIPDIKQEPNISGDLSHKYPVPKKATFIGILTRFRKPDIIPPKKIDVLVIISGPEPQRTIFENIIVTQAENSTKQFVIVSGLAEKNTDEMVGNNIRMISHMPGEELFSLILSSEIIISRGGYSTLMDLAMLNKKCIFVPTPGQTEQEYLVEELHKKKMVYSIHQNKFDLHVALEAVKNYPGLIIPADENEFVRTLEKTINALRNSQ